MRQPCCRHPAAWLPDSKGSRYVLSAIVKTADACRPGKRQGTMKRFRRILRNIGLGLLVLVLVLVVAGVWFVRRPWPQIDGQLSVAGRGRQVQVIRDKWGVPHIYAQNDHDLFFAQGYTHAQDRLWQMEMSRRAGSGTLSAFLGQVTLDNDKFVRTLGLRRA